MDSALARIPPEAWPFLVMLGNITAIVTAIWIAISVFVWWRRAATNLTPVNSAPRKAGREPDFLSVDRKARAAAIARGEDYDKALDERDAAAERARRKTLRNTGRLARWVALAMSIFTLATMISGTIFQVSYMGKLWEQYSAGERLLLVVQKHPFTFAVGALVILYNVVRFFADKKWEGEN